MRTSRIAPARPVLRSPLISRASETPPRGSRLDCDRSTIGKPSRPPLPACSSASAKAAPASSIGRCTRRWIARWRSRCCIPSSFRRRSPSRAFAARPAPPALWCIRTPSRSSTSAAPKRASPTSPWSTATAARSPTASPSPARSRRPRSSRLLAGIAAAVDAAHRQGIVHRDLKPGNILFAGAVAKVADFGLARMLESDDPGLTGGHAIGSPFYMSPEQCQGRPAGTASDVYSLGVIAYTLLTGEVPFRRGTAQEVLLAHLTEEPRSPHTLAPHLGRALSLAVMRALAKNPQARPATAGEFHAGLEQALVRGHASENPVPTLAAGETARAPLRNGAPAAGDARPFERRRARADRARRRARAAHRAARGRERRQRAAGHHRRRAGGRQVDPGARLPAPGAADLSGRPPGARALARALRIGGGLLALSRRPGQSPRERRARATRAAPPRARTHLGGAFPRPGERGRGGDGRDARRHAFPRPHAARVRGLRRGDRSPNAGGRPLVLLLEDLQWADPASVDLLAYLAPRLEV